MKLLHTHSTPGLTHPSGSQGAGAGSHGTGNSHVPRGLAPTASPQGADRTAAVVDCAPRRAAKPWRPDTQSDGRGAPGLGGA